MKKIPKIVLLSERSERKGHRTPEAQFGWFKRFVGMNGVASRAKNKKEVMKLRLSEI